MSEKWEVIKQNQTANLEGEIEPGLDMSRDNTLPAPQRNRPLNVKCFDWQENKWGRKGKVTSFKFFVCGFNLEFEQKMRNTSSQTVDSCGEKERV